MKRSFTLAPLALLAAVLAGCGGGGSDIIHSGEVSNTVEPAAGMTVSAGSRLDITSYAVASSDSISSHAWTITQAGGTGTNSAPVIGDPSCSRASVVTGAPPSNNGVSKDGSSRCTTFITVPQDTPASEWVVENVAKSSKGAQARRFTLKVLALGALDGGLAIKVPTVPQLTDVGSVTTLMASYTANAGVTFDGPVKYEWTQASGAPLPLAGAHTQMLSFTPRSAGDYVFKVRISTSLAGRALEREAAVVVTAQAPEAPSYFNVSAGPLQAVEVNKTATLAGTVSGNVDASELSYEWAQVSGPATSLFLENTLGAQFRPTATGDYVFELRATRASKQVTKASRTMVTVYQPQVQVPFFTVDAGSAQAVNLGSTVRLSGALAVGTPAPSNVTYLWTQKAGPAVTLSSATTLSPSFIAQVAGSYEFELAATSSDGQVKTDTVVVQVTPAASGSFTVSAGDIQVKLTGETIALAGKVAITGNLSSDNLVYRWTQVSGPEVAVIGQNQLDAQFRPLAKGDYVFDLTVSRADDPSIFRTDRTLVAVYDPADASREPFYAVYAGDAQIVEAGKVVRMEGSLRTGNPAPENVSYKWTQMSGPVAVIIANDATLSASFVSTTQGTYVFQLTATAGTMNKVSVTTVTLVPETTTPAVPPN